MNFATISSGTAVKLNTFSEHVSRERVGNTNTEELKQFQVIRGVGIIDNANCTDLQGGKWIGQSCERYSTCHSTLYNMSHWLGVKYHWTLFSMPNFLLLTSYVTPRGRKQEKAVY